MTWNCQPKNVTKHNGSLVYKSSRFLCASSNLDFAIESRAIVPIAPANDWDNIGKVIPR